MRRVVRTPPDRPRTRPPRPGWQSGRCVPSALLTLRRPHVATMQPRRIGDGSPSVAALPRSGACHRMCRAVYCRSEARWRILSRRCGLTASRAPLPSSSSSFEQRLGGSRSRRGAAARAALPRRGPRREQWTRRSSAGTPSEGAAETDRGEREPGVDGVELAAYGSRVDLRT